MGETSTVAAAQVPAGMVALDGRLDEAAWREAEVIELTQQDPHPGAQTPYTTQVRVLADGENLHFAFTNIDPEPESVAIHTLQRDDEQDSDDHITIVLDTLGARRLGYWFQVNAGGARTDGLNANVSTDDNWNGIRNAAVQRTPSGWTAEITISTQSLQFGSEPNLAVAGWYARTSGDVAPGQADGYGVSIEYPNDLWYAFLKANEFGDALDPALGFLPRPGTRQYLGIALYRPRPQGGVFDRVRQFEFGGEYIQVEDLDGRPQSKELAVLPFRMTTESGYFFDPVFVADYEALDAPFPIAPGVTIPAGEYRFDRYSLRGNTPESRPWVVYADFGAGDFYTGTLKSGSVEVEWTSPDGKLQLGVSNENNFGYLPQGDFIIRLTQVEAAYSFTPDLALSRSCSMTR